LDSAVVPAVEKVLPAAPASPEPQEEAQTSATDLAEIPTTGSEVMDGILLHSQQRMIEAIDELGQKIQWLLIAGGGSGSGSAGLVDKA
jgi:hypothetical protein